MKTALAHAIKKSFFASLSLLLLTLACQMNSPSPPDDDSIGTAVAQTMMALTPAGNPATMSPPTPITPCLASHPGPESNPYPDALAIVDENNVLTQYNLNGQAINSTTLPGYEGHRQLHFGSQASGSTIAYYTFDNGGELRAYRQQQTHTLAQSADFTQLLGANGSDWVAYVIVTLNPSETGWLSQVYTANLQTLSISPAPVLSRDAQDGNIHRLLGVRASQQIDGLWYTLSMWGIGNINWAPFSGLYYADLNSGQTLQFLDDTNRILALSPDSSMVAFTPGGTQNRPGNGLVLRDMVYSCQDIQIPWDATSNQGGGLAAISPNNQLVAWVEASGPDPMSATFRLRVARLSANSYTDLVNTPASQLTQIIPGLTPSVVHPVTWVDDHILLVSIYAQNANGNYLALWAPDPNQPINTPNGAVSSIPLGTGYFSGLFYP